MGEPLSPAINLQNMMHHYNNACMLEYGCRSSRHICQDCWFLRINVSARALLVHALRQHTTAATVLHKTWPYRFWSSTECPGLLNMKRPLLIAIKACAWLDTFSNLGLI